MTNQEWVWVSVCLLAASQQLYHLRNGSGGVPLTPEAAEEAKCICVHSHFLLSQKHSWTLLFITALVSFSAWKQASCNCQPSSSCFEGKWDSNISKEQSWHNRCSAPETRERNKGLWVWFSLQLSFQQVDRFKRPAAWRCWRNTSITPHCQRHLNATLQLNSPGSCVFSTWR